MLTLGLCNESRRRCATLADALNLELQEIIVEPSPLEGLKVDGHVSLDTYLRLLAPHYLQDLETVLYLDVDLVVRHSILDIYAEPLNGAHLLAVPHASRHSGFFSSERGVSSYAALGIPGMTRTFNAGVMLLNLEKWRQTNTTERILRYLREYRETVLWWDQDGLNAILHDKWRPLHAKWNVMTSHCAEFKSWEDSLLDADTFDSIKRDPGIIHYSSTSKPWTGDYTGPFKQEWEEALTEADSER